VRGLCTRERTKHHLAVGAAITAVTHVHPALLDFQVAEKRLDVCLTGAIWQASHSHHALTMRERERERARERERERERERKCVCVCVSVCSGRPVCLRVSACHSVRAVGLSHVLGVRGWIETCNCVQACLQVHRDARTRTKRTSHPSKSNTPDNVDHHRSCAAHSSPPSALRPRDQPPYWQTLRCT
jgi:hypothetical protein